MTTPTQKSPWILDADEATFQTEVVERSRQLLIVVDFWAEWCQPCRLLGPILEKLAVEYDGKFLLAKADVDKMPNIAAGFGVQSIPAVYALREGDLLDSFIGLLPEPQLRAWIDRLLPSPAEMLVSEARRLEASDPDAAAAKYAEAGRLEPNLAAAKIALADLLLRRGRAAESQAILDELEKRGFLEPEAEKLKAQLHLHQRSDNPIDLDALRARAAANPADLQARLDLAEALAASNQYAEALDVALSVVETHKKEFVDRARQLMVDVFRLLGEESELTLDYRRRLSTALY